MKQKILFQNYLSKIKSKKKFILQKIYFLFFNYSKRLSAKQSLAHPWLTRRPKSISKPIDEEISDKKLSTKKLRRFVIRRRWQVKKFLGLFILF